MTTAAPSGSEGRRLLEVEGLHVTFGRRRRAFDAVRGVDLAIDEGVTLALVGESGSGKTTTGRAVLRLLEPSQGRVLFRGTDLIGLDRRAMRHARRDLQMVFQDPFSSLDPSMVVADIVGEPLDNYLGLDRSQRQDRVRELLAMVGLSEEHLSRYPHEFSGGQRQRIAIARAIALDPALVVCDEPVSALDVSTQNQIINLFSRLSRELGLAYLFISHDLGVVEHIADHVAVMYLGEIVESGPTARVFGSVAHPYTQALLQAVPVSHPRFRGQRSVPLRGDVPDVASPPPGCSFHPRCPHAMPICSQERPPLVPVQGGGASACHLHTSGPRLEGRSLSELAST